MVRWNDLGPYDFSVTYGVTQHQQPIAGDRSRTPPEALDYIGTLPLKLLDAGDGIEVYAVHGDPP